MSRTMLLVLMALSGCKSDFRCVEDFPLQNRETGETVNWKVCGWREGICYRTEAYREGETLVLENWCEGDDEVAGNLYLGE